MNKTEFIQCFPKNLQGDARAFIKICSKGDFGIFILSSIFILIPITLVIVYVEFNFNLFYDFFSYILPPPQPKEYRLEIQLDLAFMLSLPCYASVAFLFNLGFLLPLRTIDVSFDDHSWSIENVEEFLSGISEESKNYIVGFLEDDDRPFSNKSVIDAFNEILEEEKNKNAITLKEQLQYGN